MKKSRNTYISSKKNIGRSFPNKFFLFCFLGLIFLFLVSFVVIDKIISEGKENSWINVYKTKNVDTMIYQNKIIYKLKENIHQQNEYTDLILRFDQENKEKLQIIGPYTPQDISYIPDLNNKKYGNASANFSLQNHKISLVPQKQSLFYPGKEIESFEMDFWVYPESIYEGNTILSFYGPNYIKEYDKVEYSGIKIYISQNIIMVDIAYIFYLGEEPIVLTINTNIYLDIAQWQHIAMSYNAFTGKLVFLKNGIKEKIIWLTDSGKEDGTLLTGKISEYFKNNLIIGGNFFGNIDEFNISRVYQEFFDLNTYVQEPGEIISNIIDYEYFTSKFKKFILDAMMEFDSKIYVFARSSEEIFSPDDEKIQWTLVNNDTVLTGRYLQWKLLFYTSYNGNYTPYLYDLIYSFEPNLPPAKPVGIHYELLGNGQVRIEWNNNLEPDIKGYLVYYGRASRYYICNDALEGPSPIFTKNNSIILTLPKYQDYYISIKALDDAYVYQKSEFSDEIIIRTE